MGCLVFPVFDLTLVFDFLGAGFETVCFFEGAEYLPFLTLLVAPSFPDVGFQSF
jgi:hypothetical protein